MRSKYKMIFTGKTLFSYIYTNKNIEIIFFTKKRSITIVPFLLNFHFEVYNGLDYYDLKSKSKYLGLGKKVGEFIFTRKFSKYKTKKRK